MKKKQGIAVVAALVFSAALGFFQDEIQFESSSAGSNEPASDATLCDPQSCQTQSCRKGYVLRKKSGECCPQCEKITPASPTCEGFQCDTCPEGTRVRECCPECVQAHDASCDEGRRKYAKIRPLFDERLVSCSSDVDCILTSFVDACQPTCSTPLNKMRLGEVVGELQAEAQKFCGSCAPENFECPNLNTKSVLCLGGKCLLDPDG